ncbi:uncharacterized protein LOC101845100 [Aplysia californica]|uniref:Uncharacterized protein LOC101845100 n=1 Tax=Aplysia californica TaxID=6500 RepID=A0ABM0JRB0_APLCA|nr:uncharacterized protein LOC101845100 [Aplysia californica]
MDLNDVNELSVELAVEQTLKERLQDLAMNVQVGTSGIRQGLGSTIIISVSISLGEEISVELRQTVQRRTQIPALEVDGKQHYVEASQVLPEGHGSEGQGSLGQVVGGHGVGGHGVGGHGSVVPEVPEDYQLNVQLAVVMDDSEMNEVSLKIAVKQKMLGALQDVETLVTVNVTDIRRGSDSTINVTVNIILSEPVTQGIESQVTDKSDIDSLVVDGVEYTVDDIWILKTKTPRSQDSGSPVVAIAWGVAGILSLVIVCIVAYFLVFRKRRGPLPNGNATVSYTSWAQLGFSHLHVESENFDEPDDQHYIDLLDTVRHCSLDDSAQKQKDKSVEECPYQVPTDVQDSDIGSPAPEQKDRPEEECPYQVPDDVQDPAIGSPGKEDKPGKEEPPIADDNCVQSVVNQAPH